MVSKINDTPRQIRLEGNSTLAARLTCTMEEMAAAASVDMELWDRHSNACLEAASALAVGEMCPRPCNHRPDDFSEASCVAAGECGCGAEAERDAAINALSLAGYGADMSMMAVMQQMEKLRAELARFKAERSYVIGCNEGFASAIEQAAAVVNEAAADFERQATAAPYGQAHDALLMASDALELAADAIKALETKEPSDA